MLNVTVITFALIMKQRKLCQALGFVNGPTDGSGFGFVCTRAEVATSGLLTWQRRRPLERLTCCIRGRAQIFLWRDAQSNVRLQRPHSLFERV